MTDLESVRDALEAIQLKFMNNDLGTVDLSQLKGKALTSLSALETELNEALQENKRLREERIDLSKWIVAHKDQSFYGDHACQQCHPYSDMLVPGFVCAYHQAATIAGEK